MENGNLSSNMKEQIYRAAEKVFIQYGFDAARTDEIARVAEVAKGTIYYYFPSKHELFISLVEKRVEQFASYLKQNLSDISTVEEFLTILPRARLSFFSQHGELAQWMTQSFRQFPEDMQKRIMQAVNKIDDYVVQALQKVLPEDYPVQPDVIVAMIGGSIAGLVAQHILSDRPINQEEIASDVAKVFTRALAK